MRALECAQFSRAPLGASKTTATMLLLATIIIAWTYRPPCDGAEGRLPCGSRCADDGGAWADARADAHEDTCRRLALSQVRLGQDELRAVRHICGVNVRELCQRNAQIIILYIMRVYDSLNEAIETPSFHKTSNEWHATYTSDDRCSAAEEEHVMEKEVLERRVRRELIEALQHSDLDSKTHVSLFVSLVVVVVASLTGFYLMRKQGAQRNRSPRMRRRKHATKTLECVVCMDEVASHALVPCGHLSFCRACAATTKCPVCRRDVTQSIRIYNT